MPHVEWRINLQKVVLMGGFSAFHGKNSRGEEEGDDGQPREDGRGLQRCLLSLEGDS